MIVEAELLLKDWAQWKLGGMPNCLGYPKSATFTRFSARGGVRDYAPDMDRALECAALDAAIVAVGGIHETVLRLVYLWPQRGCIERVQRQYGVSRPTAYRWLENATEAVWCEFCNTQQEKGEKVAFCA